MTASLASQTSSPSRRAILAGALGGLGAWVVGAIGRASPVRAEGEAIVVGGEYTTAESLTRILNQTNGASVFRASSTGAGVGVYGSSASGVGVYGASNSSFGVQGVSSSNIGISGHSDSNVGVSAISAATVKPAILGWSYGNSTAILGYSGSIEPPPAKAKTAIYGYAAQGSTSRGVWGDSPSGYAGYFSGKVYTTKWYELKEVTTPTAPSANRARVFVRDNGSGKTQLCVRFNTGASQVIATQP